MLPAKLSAVCSVIPELDEDRNGYISRVDSVGISVGGDVVKSILFGCKSYYE